MVKRPGRPPAGIQKGEKVQDYPAFTVRLPRDTKALLEATRDVTGDAMWKVVHEAIGTYVGRLKPTDRTLVTTLAKRKLKQRRTP